MMAAFQWLGRHTKRKVSAGLLAIAQHRRAGSIGSTVVFVAGITMAASALVSAPTHAGLGDALDKLKSGGGDVGQLLGGSADKDRGNALSEGETTAGLKEALTVGVQRAISLLGKEGGFLNDPSVRIPMPDTLKTVEKGLRAVKQDKYADEFITTMNRAAEKAIPRASQIFADAISNMTLEDAKAILNGPENAATLFFRKNTEVQLGDSIYPVVQEATSETGVTAAYKRLTQKAGLLNSLVDEGRLDLDRHVTDKALDGLFNKLALEEAKIRRDPLARSTDLLKKVFGSLAK